MIERDSESWLVASVPSLEGCHTQARGFRDLVARVREAIELYIEDLEVSPFPFRLNFHL